MKYLKLQRFGHQNKVLFRGFHVKAFKTIQDFMHTRLLDVFVMEY